MINTLNWEHLEGSGQPLTISQLVSKLQAIQTEHGDIPVRFRNYLEENAVAPLTDLVLDHDFVCLESQDLPTDETT